MVFPVVGIGASAGGLEAFKQLLEHLPSNTGLGFVLVQHLDPKHESVLVELLSKSTTMPVRQATNNVVVKPNHVYVIPPDADISIQGGILKLHRRRDVGPRRSVDYFFQSLAKDRGHRAIGIILSGTASDGTMGLEAIKAEGGITFAQDESAKFDSMPRSAATAGCVDFVLAPKEIAHELSRVALYPYIPIDGDEEEAAAGDKKKRGVAKKLGLPKTGDPFKKIVFLLRSHSGVDFSLYKPPTLQRRINRRMILNKKKTVETYLNVLRNDPAERDALYQDLLITVTGFFRNPEAFKALEKSVFPQLFKARAQENPVRVWVPGCSTGQEAYSLAMAMMEFMGDAATVPFQIYATDLNDSSLKTARTGYYVKSLVQDVSPERLKRFFSEEEGGYRVNKSIRDTCVFARHNLISDPPFSRMDLISCRNVLIYVHPETQRKIMPSFHYALKPTGFLFLGASETIGTGTDLFTLIDKKNRIYARKPGASRPVNISFPAFRRHNGEVAGGQVPQHDALGQDVQREADRVALIKYAPPGVLINDDFEILQFRGATDAYLEPPRGKATFHLLSMAREGLLMPLRIALNKAKKENQRIRKENVQIDRNGRSLKTHIDIVPLKNLKDRCFLVSFESPSKRSAQTDSDAEPTSEPKVSAVPKSSPERGDNREIARLRAELTESRDYLQALQEQYEAANEELQASSEEVQSSNEELQSINEELETSKEEIESSNEELTTVNEEMANRNLELTQLTGDLNNLHMSIDMAILLLGRDLRIRRFTPPAEKLFNLLATDVGRPLSAVKSNLDFPDLEKLVSGVIRTIRTEKREAQDKAGRWYSLRARPYLTLDNKIDGAVLTIVDISDLKWASQKVEAIVETVPPLLILDDHLKVKKANHSFCQTFRVEAKETEGRQIYDLGNRQWNIPKLKILLEEILPRKKVFSEFEVEHTFETIGHRTMIVSGREVDSGNPADRAILLTIQDVTERKQALKNIQAFNDELEVRIRQRAAQLTASNEELEAFCYSVAHDLRAPLRSIEGFSQVLQKYYVEKLDVRGQNYFDRIRAAARRMGHLIDSLLDLSRLTRAEMRQNDIDLSQQARLIADDLRKRQPKRVVEFAIAPGLNATGDDRLTRIALTNLLENAWKFTSKHARARIEVGSFQKDGERVYFVRDDGAGFEMAYADKLFQTFQRIHSPDEFQGTGIGLTIVQRIIQRHGGRIWAEGAVERGATFFFTLPLPDHLVAKRIRKLGGGKKTGPRRHKI